MLLATRDALPPDAGGGQLAAATSRRTRAGARRVLQVQHRRCASRASAQSDACALPDLSLAALRRWGVVLSGSAKTSTHMYFHTHGAMYEYSFQAVPHTSTWAPMDDDDYDDYDGSEVEGYAVAFTKAEEQPYGVFSDFHQRNLVYNGMTFKSAACVLAYMKVECEREGTSPDETEKIKDLDEKQAELQKCTGWKAKILTGKDEFTMKNDGEWKKKEQKVMRKVLKLKFDQDGQARELLMSTHPRPIEFKRSLASGARSRARAAARAAARAVLQGRWQGQAATRGRE